jgi:teichoic acid transport system ATP-binding protein
MASDPLVSPVAAPPQTEPVTVSVRSLHVRYKVYTEQQLTLKELAARGFRQRASVDVHAVRGVSFDVHRGEAVAILGANGSGKSTLLRAVAGLQTPNEGEVLVSSRPRLLGVGATLKPELSGRRNIVLGALAMGLRLGDIEGQVENVIEFAELHEAIDRPLKTYSSGMRARLAFGIATLNAPEIMLIDEALAVGDRRFRKKSLERLRALQAAAGTLLMVTHNLNEIKQTCSRAVWLEQGTMVMDGPAKTVIDAYTGGEAE